MASKIFQNPNLIVWISDGKFKMAAILVNFQMVSLPDFRSHLKSKPFANWPPKSRFHIPKFSELNKISAKRGTDSRFVVEANLKSLCPKSSWGSILKPQNRGYKSAKLEARIVKADFWRSDSNITRVELSPLIRPSIRPRIIPDYWVFFE